MVYIRRFIWFIASHLVIACILLGMLVCGFFMCLNLANVYIILDEGLEKRVEVILTREDAEELNKYFHYDFLNADPALAGSFDGTSIYADYTITGFDYEMTVESLWSWPWDKYATCTIVERVPDVRGKVISSRASELPATPPDWQGGRYNITLIREEGEWKIIGMQQTTILMESADTGAETETLVE